MPSGLDIVLVLLTILLPVCYLYRESLPIIGGRTRSDQAGFVDVKKRAMEEDGDPRDFVEKMKKGVSVTV
jgi:NADPH-ferrihemoprotein reductase